MVESVNLKPVQLPSEKVSSNNEQNQSNANFSKNVQVVSEKIENTKSNSKEKNINQISKKSK